MHKLLPFKIGDGKAMLAVVDYIRELEERYKLLLYRRGKKGLKL
jgi:hypothetical protein